MRTLPYRPNLDHLRQQAKDLLRELRAASAEPASIRLYHAQRLLAERYGFDSWPELRAHVDRMAEVERWVLRWVRTYGVGVEPAPTDLMCDGLLRHPNNWVRWNCAGLLVRAAVPRTVAALSAALADPIPKVRKHALASLVRNAAAIGADVVPVLAARVLRDDNPGIRLRLVAELLRRRDDPRAAMALDIVAATDPHRALRDVAGGRDTLRGGWTAVLHRGQAREPSPVA